MVPNMKGVSAQFSAGQMVRNHASLEAPSSPSFTDSEVLLSVCSQCSCIFHICSVFRNLDSTINRSFLEAIVEAWRTHTPVLSPPYMFFGASQHLHLRLIFYPFLFCFRSRAYVALATTTLGSTVPILACRTASVYLEASMSSPPQSVPETVLSSRKAPKTQPLGYSSLNPTPSPGVSQTYKQVLRREELCCIILTKSRSA